MAHNPPVFTLDQIKAQLQTQWTVDGSDPHTETWAGTTVTYGLPRVSPDRSPTEAPGFTRMDATQQSFVREAFDMWDDLIAIDLVETTTNPHQAQITFAYSTTTDNDGSYTTPFLAPLQPGGSEFERKIEAQRIWFSQSGAWQENQSANIALGSRGLENMIHEIGHALGLSHPGSYNAGDADPDTYHPDAEYTQDTQQWTVMSYFRPGADGTTIDRTGTGFRDVDGNGVADRTFISSPLLHDIAAIQAKYGADMTTRTGNDIYGFNSRFSGDFRTAFDFSSTFNKNPVVAIWDAGGTDTLNVSGFTQDQRIDLRAGAFSDVGALTLNVAIAFNVTLENAVGGPGNDTISGNLVANNLRGGDGRDFLRGFSGADTLIGGNGSDTLGGGGGEDIAGYLSATGENIRIEGVGPSGDGRWIVTGMADGSRDSLFNIESFVFGSGGDEIRMIGSNENTLNGAGGDDRIFGGGGPEVIIGGSGTDLINPGDGKFTIFGGFRNANGDWVESADQADTLRLDYRGETTDKFLIVSPSPPLDIFLGGNGSSARGISRLEYFGSSGGDVVDGGVLDDEFLGLGGSDSFRGRRGSDVARGGAGTDTLDGNEGADRLFGEENDDRLNGGDQGDFISGGGGNDTIGGGDGNDEIFTGEGVRNIAAGDAGEDTITGGGGDDTLNGGDHDDTLRGLGGEDFLIGDAGRDLLEGGLEKDTLDGRVGGDTLIGGRGADSLNAGSDEARDLIRVASRGDSGRTEATWDRVFQFDRKDSAAETVWDRIDLSRLDADNELDGNQRFRFVDKFSQVNASTVEGQVRIESVGSDVNVRIDFDGNTTTDMVIRVLGVEDLGRADILL